MSNIHLQQPESHKIPTPHGPLCISVDLDGSRWVPIKAISEFIGMSQAEIMKKLDRNPKYFGYKPVLIPEPWKTALPLCRVSEFLHSVKSFQVSKAPAYGWLQANVYRIVHDFQLPAPVVPLIPTEPEPVHEVVRTPRPKVKAEPEPMAVVSSELIPIQRISMGGDEVNAVSGRDLHAFLEVGKVFAAWMPEQIEAFGFVEGQDFEVCFPNLESEGRGGKNLKEYMISLTMAKELAMVQRTAKGKQARLYFIECERRVSAPASVSAFRVPTTMIEAMELATEALKINQQQALAMVEKDATIAILEPKAAGLDLIATASEGSMTLRQAAKVLQQKERAFIAMLHQIGWIFRQGTSNLGYVDRVHAGYLEHKMVKINEELTVPQVLITRKGLAKLAQMLGVAA